MLPKILLVEDSILLRTVLRNALKESGFIVYEAENGRNALMSVREVSPDMVVLDVLMPVMDGMVMYDTLRKESWGKEIPVVMLTSSEGPEVQEWITARALTTVKKDDAMVATLIAEVTRRLAHMLP